MEVYCITVREYNFLCRMQEMGTKCPGTNRDQLERLCTLGPLKTLQFNSIVPAFHTVLTRKCGSRLKIPGGLIFTRSFSIYRRRIGWFYDIGRRTIWDAVRSHFSKNFIFLHSPKTLQSLEIVAQIK